MRKYGYLVVEGPHDVEFAYRLLSPLGVKRIQFKKDLDKFFYNLIPESYPLEDDDIQKRMPIPVFLQSETHAIAIHSATGDSQLVDWMEENIAILGLNGITGLGILLDADSEISANQRYAEITQELAKKLPMIKPLAIGMIKQGQPNFGVFVLPDNSSVGTLENLLLESAEVVYPDLLKLARDYVSEAKEKAGLKPSELKELKNAGKNKAIIGTMATIMKPGKSVQVSIQDNRWLREPTTLSLPRIKAVQEFLQILFELPVESTQQLN